MCSARECSKHPQHGKKHTPPNPLYDKCYQDTYSEPWSFVDEDLDGFYFDPGGTCPNPMRVFCYKYKDCPGCDKCDLDVASEDIVEWD